ncbi:MAG: hypothetical protein ACI87E_001067 [Mariniblastus sp.]
MINELGFQRTIPTSRESETVAQLRHLYPIDGAMPKSRAWESSEFVGRNGMAMRDFCEPEDAHLARHPLRLAREKCAQATASARLSRHASLLGQIVPNLRLGRNLPIQPTKVSFPAVVAL